MRLQSGPVRIALFVIAALLAGDARTASRFDLPPSPPAPRIAADSLFFDDFSGGAGRWTFDREGVWSVRDEALWADLPDGKQSRSFAYAGSEKWGDYAVDVDVCQLRGVDKGVAVRVRGGSGTAVDVRGPGYEDVLLFRGEFPLARASAPSGNGAWHHLRVECRGGEISVLLDGAPVLRHGKARAYGGDGRIALPAYTGGGGECTVVYDNVLVTRLR